MAARAVAHHLLQQPMMTPSRMQIYAIDGDVSQQAELLLSDRQAMHSRAAKDGDVGWW